MGLFGKKEQIPDGIRVQYYEGELKEFPVNYACQLLLLDDVLRITKIKPFVEVRLDRQRILGIDIFMDEAQYMAKYKGVDIVTSKCKSIPKHYYVLNYLDKSGEKKHIDFWGTVNETGKIRKMNEELSKNQSETSYDI